MTILDRATRIEFKTNTQIHTKISSKNSKFKCIFRSTNHIARILLKNSHTTTFRKLKNSGPYIIYFIEKDNQLLTRIPQTLGQYINIIKNNILTIYLIF